MDSNSLYHKFEHGLVLTKAMNLERTEAILSKREIERTDEEKQWLDQLGNTSKSRTTLPCESGPIRAGKKRKAREERGSGIKKGFRKDDSVTCLQDGYYVNTTAEDMRLPHVYTSNHYTEFQPFGLVCVTPPKDTRLSLENKVQTARLKNRPRAFVKATTTQTIVSMADNGHGAKIKQHRPLAQSWLEPSKQFAKIAAIPCEPGYPIARSFASPSAFGQALNTDTLYGENTFSTEVVLKEEERFWSTLDDAKIKRHYDSERELSFYDKDDGTTAPNLLKIGDPLSKLLELGYKAEGINTPYVYSGKRNTFFPLHKEDLDFCSLNVHHGGAPKIWYSFAAEHNEKFEAILAKMFPDDFRKCGLFLRHKEHLINPFHVAAQGIPVFRTIQHPGQTVLTMPGCYHWGFNTGYSLNEAVNYVIPQWEGFGICARVCKCTGGFEGYTWFASLFKEHFEVTVFAHDEVSSKRKSDALERWKALEGKN